MKTKPPFLLILLIIAFFFAAFASVLQVGQTILGWNWLTALGYLPSPLYSVFKGSFLFLAFLVSAIALWIRVRWAPEVAGISTAAAILWSWIERLWINPNPLTLKSQIFLIIASLGVLSIVEFSLFLLVPYMKMGVPAIKKGS